MGNDMYLRGRLKLLVGLLIAGLLAVGVAACGGSSGGSESSSSPSTTSETPSESGESGTTAGEGGESEKSPILIGLATGKTGGLAAYDLPATEALELSLKKINEEGGADGTEFETKWIDTKFDKTLAASAATQLINEGAAVIVTPCDFDYGSPAAFAAKAQDVPAISICASSPKNATPAIIGELGYSMGTGSDTEGVDAAEFAVKDKSWKKAYLLEDTSLEYSKAAAAYFKKRFEELGGEIVGEDSFVGGENTDVSAQATRAASAAANADFVYLGSWEPGGAIAYRTLRQAGVELPIITDQAVDGKLLTEIGGKVSNLYSLPLACMPSYCEGNEPSKKSIDQFSKEFENEYNEELTTSYPINGYDLGTVLKQAVETAGSDEPKAIGEAIETMGPVQGLNSKFEFTKECHKPVGQDRVVLEWNQGKAKYLTTLSTGSIPDIGDANPCTGPQTIKE